jgi:hypothetical protein
MPCGARVEIASVEVSEVVVVDDHTDLAIRVLPILPEAQLGAIVRRILVEHGWAESEDGTLTKPVGDAVATLLPGASTIRVTLASDEEEVRVEHTGKAASRAAAEVAARDGAADKLVKAAADKRRELTRKTADELLAAAAALRPELDRVTN